jgi:hypothetical protein
MAGEKGKTAAQSEASRRSKRITAIQRGQDGGKVSAYAGAKTAEKRQEPRNDTEAVNADAIKRKAEEAAKQAAKVEAEAKQKEKERKAKESADYEAGKAAAGKKKLSAADIMMGKR